MCNSTISYQSETQNPHLLELAALVVSLFFYYSSAKVNLVLLRWHQGQKIPFI